VIRSELSVPSDYVVEKFKESIYDNKAITVEHMRNQTLLEDGVKLSYTTLWRGKQKDLESANDNVMK
jgi:hypothetical protein